MTNTELILNMLAEASTTDISQSRDPQVFEENVEVARQGGKVACVAPEELEARTGKKVVTSQNAKKLLKLGIRKRRNNKPDNLSGTFKFSLFSCYLQRLQKHRICTFGLQVQVEPAVGYHPFG